MKYQFTISALFLLVISSASAQLLPSHAAPAPPLATSLQVTGKPVARVNGAVLNDRDLLREMFALFPYARLHNGFPKNQEAEIRRGAMQMIIFEELAYQEAMRRRMTIASERVVREQEKFRRHFGSQAEFNAYLKADMDGSETKLRQQIKRSLLIEALLRNEVESKSAVSVSQARLYYDKNPKMFEHGELVAIQTISIIPPANANPEALQEARQRAEAVLEKAKATKNYEEFGLLAERVSDDDFRVDMGDRKQVKPQNLPPEVVKAVLGMKRGDVSGLIQLGTAYTIVRLNAHTLPGKAKFADVKVELTARLQKEKYEKLRVALGQRLRQNAKIQEL
ncbi:MAG: peptidylprolyl isomerase [Terriglobales bacterium]